MGCHRDWSSEYGNQWTEMVKNTTPQQLFGSLYFFVIKSKLRWKKSLKRFLSPHTPLHVYTVQITVQPHISENTAKPSVILHFFVHSHCHARILNTTVKNTTKANSLNPEKPSFWLTMMKSSFTIDSLKVSHLHISRVCSRRQERTAASSGLVWHSWMETTQMYP